jgi:hypothetical protein
MKKIIYFTVIILMLTALGCSDFLDRNPYGSITGGNMWQTESMVEQGVIGVYKAMKAPLSAGDLTGEGGSLGYWGFEVYGMGGQATYAINNLFNSNCIPSNTRFLFAWQWCFDGIHRANEAIAYIPGTSAMTDERKACLVAECKILRGYFYMRLNELFGSGGIGVPLYMEPLKSYEDANKGQSPEAEVWAQIVKDFTEAINEPNLPDHDIGGEGRVSKGAAYAFRGRAYLMTGEYSKAAADFGKVGDCGYGLFGDYKQLFKVAAERCKEMIVSVQYIEDPAGYGNKIQKYCGLVQAGAADAANCWTNLQFSPDLIDKFEVITDDNTAKAFDWTDYFPQWRELSVNERRVFFLRDTHAGGREIHSSITSVVNTQLKSLSAAVQAFYLAEGNEARLKKAYAKRDPRLSLSVILPYSEVLGSNANPPTGEALYVHRWPVPGKYYATSANAESNFVSGMLPTITAGDQSMFYYTFRKFVGEGMEYMRIDNNPVDEPVIRYADVLLMWAEALVESNDLVGAKAKVKEVRDRAGIPTPDDQFTDQSTARRYVRDERRRELIGEGVNFFDEMRWKTLKETKFSQAHPQTVWGGVCGGTTYEWIGDYWYTWPVPKAEAELNLNLTRTPGWTY